MNTISSEQALLMIAWSRIWSPVVDDKLRSEAWQALDLPSSYEANKSLYWTTFHVGAPQPQVPLVLHAALSREGTGAREDWLRVISHLGLSWDNVHLPPDQLGAACEIYACAIERQEQVLVKELGERYLLPWCDIAAQSLAQVEPVLLSLVESFKRDLVAISEA